MVGSVVGSILAGWFPQLDRVSLGIVDSCEAAVGIVLRIALHFDTRGAELRGHLVQVSHAKVDHPNLTWLAKIFRCFREGRERRPGRARSSWPSDSSAHRSCASCRNGRELDWIN
jgi:hypothetical protein